MSWRGRSAQRGHGVPDTRLVEHQNVGVALDDERRSFLANGLRNLRKPVEQVRLLNISVSGEFKYFGWASPKALAPNPTILPRRSEIGKVILPAKRSPPLDDNNPAASRMPRSNPSLLATPVNPELPLGGA